MVTIARDYVAALRTAVEEEEWSHLIGRFDFGSAGLRLGVSLNFSVPDATAWLALPRNLFTWNSNKEQQLWLVGLLAIYGLLEYQHGD